MNDEGIKTDGQRTSRRRLDVLHSSASTRNLGAAEMHPIARMPEEWAELLESWGERRFHARQIFRWIHARGVVDPDQMSDISKGLRQRLKVDGLAPASRLTEIRRAADDTRKLLLELDDGKTIECVMIPMTSGAGDDTDSDDFEDDEFRDGYELGEDDAAGAGEALVAKIASDSSDKKKRRITLCVSTQHGCAMGCVFCASGRNGLSRGLGAAEIVAQVLEARRHLGPDENLTNLVFMGMGEPLHHYDETARAIRLLMNDNGVGLGLRRMTVSTVGLIRGIERLGQDFEGKIGLAVSLHAPNDLLRSKIVPMNEKVNLDALIGALKRYPLPRRRRITIEYILIAGLNDSLRHAQELARLLRPLRVKVNLISMNSVDGTGLVGSTDACVAQFRDWIVSEGVSCFVRTRRGDEVAAACGQLALRANPVE